MTFFVSLSAFAGTFDEYGYNNSSYGSPMYNTGAMGGGTYWSQLARDFYTQSNAVDPYSYSRTIETKVKTSESYIVSDTKPADSPNTIVVKYVSPSTGWDMYKIYPATTITSTQENTVNLAQANTNVLNTYGPNTYYNFNIYNPEQQNYIYRTYQATTNGPVLVGSATQSGPPPTSVPYTAIPRSASTGPLDSSPGSKFLQATQLYNKQTLTLSEASKVIINYIDRVIPDATNGRALFIQNTISKVAEGLPPSERGKAEALLIEYMTAEESFEVTPSDGIPPNNFPPGKNNIFTASGEVSGKQGVDGYELQIEIDNVLVKPSQLDRSKPSLKTLGKIVALYAKSKGFYGTVVVTNREGSGAAFYANGVLTVRKSTFEKGFFDNVNNLKSALDHEIGHFHEPTPVRENYKFKDHFAIYLLQASSPDFKHTTDEIKINNSNGYINRVLNSAAAHEVGMNDAGILTAINKYNAENTGGVVISNAYYLGSYAGYSFTTTIDGIEKYNGFKYELLEKKED